MYKSISGIEKRELTDRQKPDIKTARHYSQLRWLRYFQRGRNVMVSSGIFVRTFRFRVDFGTLVCPGNAGRLH